MSKTATLKTNAEASPALDPRERESRTKDVRGRRPPLVDVSNRRRTRSSTAHKHEAQKPTITIPTRRRSQRLSSRKGTSTESNDSQQISENEKRPRKRSTSRGRSRNPRTANSSKERSPKDHSKASEKNYDKQPTKAQKKLTKKRSLKNTNEPSLAEEVESNECSQQPISKRSRLSREPNLHTSEASSIADPEPTANETVQSPSHSFSDILDEAHHNLALTPFDQTKYTAGISVYDTPSKGKVLEAPEYVTDIFQRLYKSETQHLVEPYMHQQTSINEVMRAILVDWIIEVHMKFRLEQETLHLSVNIIDRYLSAIPLDRKYLQLLGVTALLLASKYEEIYPPEVKDCVYITDRAYSRQEILDMEANILAQVKFNLTVPTAFPFLQRFLFITKATETMKCAANYYLDRMLQEHDALRFRPSLLAAAVVCLALNHPEIRDLDGSEEPKAGLPKTLLEYTGFHPSDILNAAKFVASKVTAEIQTLSRRQLVAVKRKYDEARYKFISVDFEPPSVDDIDVN